jgi:hypothetical protein
MTGTGLRTPVRNIKEIRQTLARIDRILEDSIVEQPGGVGAPLISFRAVPFMTDVTDADGNPTVTYETGTVPAGKVVSSVEYQTGELTVTIVGEVDGGPQDFTPTVTIEGENVSGSPVAVTLSALGTSTRRYSFSQAITLTGAGDVAVATADGNSHTVAFTEAEAPPDITTFTHGTVTEYQATQTRVKNGDTVSFSATFPAGASTFVLENFELHGTTAQEYAIDPSDTSISDTFTVAGSNGTAHNIKAHLELASGAPGNSLESTNAGLFHDSDTPTLANVAVSNYPGSQSALKDSESCDCTAALTGSQGDNGQYTDWSSILYSDNGTSELTIPSTTDYGETKTVDRAGGDYRESGNNYKIVVTKSYNGTTTTKYGCVKIAHVLPTITVSESSSRMRSKTGTAKTHTITITSNQYLPSAPSLARDSGGGDDGPALGAFGGGPTTWTATLTSEEDDLKNTGAASYTWQSLSATNRAAKEQTSITGDATYVIGGFEQRDVSLLQFDKWEPIGTMATNKDNPNKITCEYVGIGAGTYVANTTEEAGTRKFTITDASGDFDADGTYCRCLDPDIFDNVDYTMRIEEAV